MNAAPSRLEGFGMPQVEASSCERPVLSIKAMSPLDTMLHGETALLARAAREISLSETTLGAESGFQWIIQAGHQTDWKAVSDVC